MPSREELKARAQQFLKQAKRAPESSESLLYVMRSVECDAEADALDADLVQPHVMARQALRHR